MKTFSKYLVIMFALLSFGFVSTFEVQAATKTKVTATKTCKVGKKMVSNKRVLKERTRGSTRTY